MKQLFKIGSAEGLDPAQSDLLIELGDGHCCFGIVDHANKMLVKLVYYSSPGQDKENMLENLLNAHGELKNGYRKKVIGFYETTTIITPAKFYNEGDNKTVIEAVYDKGNKIFEDHIKEWQLSIGYQVSLNTEQMIREYFSGDKSLHYYSAVLKNNFNFEGQSIFIDFKTACFSVIGFKNNSLQFAQIFSYAPAADVLYYLLKVCQQFGFSQLEVEIILSGLVDKNSPLFKELYQYFRNITFAPANIRLSVAFEEYPVHFFFSLYNLLTCA